MIVKIDKLDHEGRGITKIDGKITFVKNALPNEIVDIEITKNKKNFNIAETKKIIESNKDRVTPKCPYYSNCGGCELMHMNYNAQIMFKKEKVLNILKKYANIEIDNIEIFPSNQEFNYRNKITLHSKNNILGFMKEETNEIIEISSCLIADKNINDYISKIRNKVNGELIIRTNEKGEIISNLNDYPLIIKIYKYKFYIDINSFFQINNYISETIIKYIHKNIEKTTTCLDLYSGVGFLSIIASEKANKVYGIEINEFSYKNALKNIELNNINNVTFLLGPVKEKIKEIKENIDLIITDPPRFGMDKITLESIKEISPKKIIYMSCNPITLARDLKDLKDKYNIESIGIFDMFPNTKHVECVCVLNRK